MVLNWLTPLSKVYHQIQTSKNQEGHGGEGETARILVTHPELVHLDRAVKHHVPPGDMRKIQGPEHIKTGGGIFYATRRYKDHTPYGHIGDPALATEAAGTRATLSSPSGWRGSSRATISIGYRSQCDPHHQ